MSVPLQSRGRFFAAATAVALTFAVFGLVTSLATLTGARSPHQLLAAAIPALLAGIGLLTLAVWVSSPSFGIFLAGDLIAGVGAGLMFKGAIETVAEVSLPEHRADAVAGFFLAAHIGLAGPVIGLGALTQIASTPVSLLCSPGCSRSASSPRPRAARRPWRSHLPTPATSHSLKRSHSCTQPN